MNMSCESDSSKKKGRGSSFEAIKHFLQRQTYPRGLNNNEKRTLRKRVKSFVLIGDKLFYTGGRWKKGLGQLTDADDNPENEPDHTQTLKKVLFTKEEQQTAVDQAHIAENGIHIGIGRTMDRVFNEYYWTGMYSMVCNTIHNCPTCDNHRKPISSSTKGINSNNPLSMCTTSASVGTASECSRFQRGELEDAAEFKTDADMGILNEGIDGTGDAIATHMNPQTVNMTAPPSMEHVPKENSSYFWQKVEIQVFGPYQADGQQVYVAIALDCYSQFPEATVMKILSSATVTNFVLNLFCRYGMMEKLSLLQNKVTNKKDFIVNTNDLLQAGISPSVLFPEIDPFDKRWLNIEKSLDRFVTMHPEVWYHCLETCLMPLRVTLPPEADYSPYFLIHSREPTLPKKLTEHWNIHEPGMCEVQLNEDQEKQAVEMVTAAFSIDTTCPFPARIPIQNKPVMATMANLSDHQYATNKPKICSARNHSQNRNASVNALGTKGQRRKQYSLLYGLPALKLKDVDSPDTVPEVQRSIAEWEESDSSQVFLVDLQKKQDNLAAIGTNLAKRIWNKSLLVMKELSFDTFCFLLAQYIQCGMFPPELSASAKDSVIHFSHQVDMKDGMLYSKVGRSSLRRFVTGEKARFGILRKAHIHREKHHSRTRALKFLAETKLFWKGMSRDLDAFIHGCPECMLHNPLHNKPVVRIPSKPAELSAEDETDDDPHLSEDEEEEIQYEHIIKFLTDGTFPSTVTPFKRSLIELHSKSMCMIDEGSSQYLAKIVKSNNASELKFVQVIITEDLRQSAIHKFHIENGEHLSAQVTQSRLRKHYFWRGMTADVLVHVSKCCMEKNSESFVPHLNPVIQSRVERFQEYYSGYAFPKLDTTLISVNPANNPESEETSMAGQIFQKHPEVQFNSPKHSNQTMDQYVAKVVEQIIDKNCKALIREDGQGSGSNAQFPNTKYGIPKNCQKCPHCGKIIRGNVAYKEHIYKHTGSKQFICDVCGMKFSSSGSLISHNRLHTGVRPYLCSYCGLGFHHRKLFRTHLTKHSKAKTPLVTCDICGRTCSSQRYLNIHKRFKHTDQTLMCNQCGKCFTVLWRLKRHEKSHLGVRN